MINQEPLPEPRTNADRIMMLHLASAVRKKTEKNPAVGLGLLRNLVQKHGSYLMAAKALMSRGKKG